MATSFKLPELGENITAGDVVKVLVANGQSVEKNQIVLEIETDKAVIEVPSTVAGQITNVSVSAGQKIKVGEVIFTYETKSAATTSPSIAEKTSTEPKAESTAPTQTETKSQTQSQPAPANRSFVLPELGENITQGEVVKILVKTGDVIKAGSNVIEVETDKAVIEVPCAESGIVRDITAKVGQKIRVGETIFTFTPEAKSTQNTAPAQVASIKSNNDVTEKPQTPKIDTAIPKSQPQLLTVPHLPQNPVLAAPSVRKLAREIGVDLHDVVTTQSDGRITLEDVKAHAKKMSTEFKAQKLKPSGGTLPQIELPDFSRWGEIETTPMSGIRKATALRMTQAWTTIPQVTQTDEADVTLLEDLRKKFGKRAENLGIKLTSTAILLKIVGSALKVFPQFNASLNMATEEIIHKKYYHIGVAVDTDRGLLVPVVRDINKKNILDLAKELGELSEKARARKTTLDEMQGASFTISNLGGIGGGHFTPIVNPPEVAILGVGQWKYRPIWIENEFKPRKILPLSLTYDHRLIDGADAARFLRWLCEAVQDPFLMELEG